jgi:hypothetical protein
MEVIMSESPTKNGSLSEAAVGRQLYPIAAAQESKQEHVADVDGTTVIRARPNSSDVLALLTAVPDRSAIYRVVQQREPAQDPEEWVVAAVTRLAEAGMLGLALDALSISILRCLLRDQCLEETVALLDVRFPGAAIWSREAEVERARQNLRSSLLKPLFTTEEGSLGVA